jgi:hypothetical protein
MTTRPGRNFRVDGFGVCSVWINKPTSLIERERAGPLSVARGWEWDVSIPSSASDVGTPKRRIKLKLESMCKNIME